MESGEIFMLGQAVIPRRVDEGVWPPARIEYDRKISLSILYIITV